jgi:hypothetical protein
MSSCEKSLVKEWRQTGRVSLWRYTENERNYPGWNLNADAVGCQSLLELLDALTIDGTATRTITLTPPTTARLSVPNNKSGAAAWLAPNRWRITLSSRPEDWDFPANLEPAALLLGSNWLDPLRACLSGIQAGVGDQSIGDRKRGLALWFWW